MTVRVPDPPFDLPDAGARLYEQLAPLAYSDAALDWPLAKLCFVLGGTVQPIEDLVRDSDDRPGWGTLFDPDAAPGWALPWLAQVAGVTLLRGVTDAQNRDRIKSTDGQRRGTPQAMIGAVRPLLTGARSIYFRERETGPYQVTLLTRISETPDTAAVLAAALEQKPAGIVLDYAAVDGQVWNEIAGTWNTISATTTWNQAVTTNL